MLLRGVVLTLARKSVECRDDVGARLARRDDHVDVAALCRLVRGCELLDVLCRTCLLVGMMFAAPAGPMTAISEVGHAMT